MKNMTIWAARSPKKARVVIGILQSILVTIGIINGTLLYKSGIILSENLIYLIAILFSIAIIMYPLKKNSYKLFYFKGTFIRQKVMDGIIALCIFLLAILGANQYHNKTLLLQNSSIIENVYAADLEDNSIKDNNPGSKVKKDESKKNKRIKRLEKKIAKIIKRKKSSKFNLFKRKITKDRLTGGQVLGIIGTVFFGIFLILALALVSCTIACNGMGALAIIIFVGGFVGIIALMVNMIKNIVNKEPIPKES